MTKAKCNKSIKPASPCVQGQVGLLTPIPAVIGVIQGDSLDKPPVKPFNKTGRQQLVNAVARFFTFLFVG